MESSQLSQWVGEKMKDAFQCVDVAILSMLIAFVVTMTTEVASNTATTQIFTPIMSTLARETGVMCQHSIPSSFLSISFPLYFSLLLLFTSLSLFCLFLSSLQVNPFNTLLPTAVAPSSTSLIFPLPILPLPLFIIGVQPFAVTALGASFAFIPFTVLSVLPSSYFSSCSLHFR